MAAATVLADGCFAGFAAFGLGIFEGCWGGGIVVVVVVRGRGFLCGGGKVNDGWGKGFGLSDAAPRGCMGEEIEFFGDVGVVECGFIVVVSFSLLFA